MKYCFKSIVLLIVLFTLGSYTTLTAQDKEFWFVVPDAARAHADNPIFFMITAGARETTVTMSMPANGSFTPMTKKLQPFESWKILYTNTADVDVFENSIHNSNKVTNKGIQIKATESISVYYQIDGGGQKEIFTLKGEKALGSEFYTPFQTVYSLIEGAYNGENYRQIQIVATEDNTVVRFKSPYPIANSEGAVLAANVEHVKILNRGQTLLLRESVRNGGLIGTHVKTDGGKKIAITVYEDSVQSQGQDPIGDQIVPVSNVGTNYIVVKGFTVHTNDGGGVKNTVDHVYILATQDNTEVKMGGVSQGVIHKGQHKVFDIGDGNTPPFFRHFETSKPAYCFHQSADRGEVGGSLIPSMYSIASKRISFENQALQTRNSIFLIYREAAKNSFKIKLASQAEKSLAVQNNATGVDGWLFSRQDLEKVAGTTTITNSDGAFALGYFASPSPTSLYGYLSNFGSFSLGTSDVICHCGDSYTFDGGYAKSYKWTDPDGIVTTNPTLVATKSGRYQATVNQDPDLITDEIYLKLQNFKGDYVFPTTAFAGEPVDFSIKINTTDPDNIYRVKYEWTFSDEASSYSITMDDPALKSGQKVEVKDVVWTTEGRKTITVKITNHDAGCSESIVKNILIRKYPDNISDATCYVEPKAKIFTISSPINFSNVHSMSTPLVADLEGLGAEIVVPRVFGAGNPWSSDGLVIANVKKNTRREIATVPFATHGQSVAIADVDNDGKCEIFIQHATDSKIYCYTPSGAAKPGFGTTIALGAHYIPQLADLNNDGVPELIAGPYIFNARTGALLLQMAFEADGTAYGNPHALWANAGYAYNGYYFMPAIGDVDGDGYLEIAAGSTVYKPNPAFTGYTKTRVNTSGQPSQFKGYLDGPTVLADFDLDGQLDVCVIGHKVTQTAGGSPFQFYVWSPNTQKVIAYSVDNSANNYITIPYVGDLDGNGFPDFAFACSLGMVSYQYDKTQPGNIKPGPAVPAFAETAGFTMFDFNQDGKSEIIYRGNTYFYIVDLNDAKDGYIEVSTKTQAWSGTVAEYPIVADVDGDGQAEIILTRANQPWSSGNLTGVVSVYKTADNTQPWAPARSVWNQWNYNSVNINDDMTIPKFPLSPGAVFSGKDGVIGTADDVRPYNGMLLQQTSLSKKGETLFLTPDAQIVSPQDVRFDYNVETGTMTISNLKIINKGSVPLNAPIKITVYKDAAASGNHHYTYSYPVSLAVNETKTVSFDVPNFKIFLPTSNLVIKVNDDGEGENDQLACNECDPKNSSSFDNIAFGSAAWAEPYKNCVGGTVNFKSTSLPGASVTYKWLNPNNTQLAVTANTSKSNLTLTDAGRYVFTAAGVNGDLSFSYTLPYLSVAPTIMYWKQNGIDNNWNNLDNWATDINGTSLKAIPAPCTTVHIPGGSTFYPSLDKTSTPRTLYGEPTVQDIVFHYKSELAYQHMLSYEKAYVQYNFGYYGGVWGAQPTKNADNTAAPILKRGSWYTLSAPLKYMASGDFALAGYPFTWQAKHEIASLGINGLVTVNNKSFKTNDVPLLSTYNTIALKVAGYNGAANAIGYNNHRDLEGLKGIIQIPYFFELPNTYYPGQLYDKFSGKSTFFYFDATNLRQLHSPVGKMTRDDKAYRFVYENETTNAVDNITIPGKGTVKGYRLAVTAPDAITKKVLMGNPFLASINAERFINANPDVDKSAGYLTYANSTQTWEPRSYNSTNNINSFQSFIITLKNSSGTVYFPLEGDNLALTGPTFVGNTPLMVEQSLYVRTTDSEGKEGSYAILGPQQTGNISNIEKVVSMDKDAAPEVFFVDDTNQKYNLLQFYKEGMKEIGLGVKTSTANKHVVLNFENVTEFAFENNVHPILIDKQKGIKHDLTVNNTYAFVHQGENVNGQYIDIKRFVFRFINAGDEALDSDNITIFYKNGNLKVESFDILDCVNVYNLAGSKIYESDKKLNSNIFDRYISLPAGVYIVKAYGLQGNTQVEKIIVP